MSSVMRFDEWQDSDGNPVFNGAGGVSPGGLIAVKSAIFTGTQVAGSVAIGGDAAVTDLSITHEVADASNKLIISAFIGSAYDTSEAGRVGIAVHDGTNLIGIGTPAGSRSSVTSGGQSLNGSDGVVYPSITFVHTPGAGSKTYTLRVINMNGSAQNLFINRSKTDGDIVGSSRAVSSLVIQEVAV